MNNRYLHVCFVAALAAMLIGMPTVRARDPLEGMSLEQRVGQMFMITLHGAGVTEVGAEFLRRWQPGALVLFTSNTGTPAAVTRLTNGYQQVMRDIGAPPLFISIDQEGGLVQRLTEGFTVWPAPLVITASGMAETIGATVGTELAAVGINMNLAPVADLETNRANPIIRRRSFGTDPQLVGEATAAYAQGSRGVGVLATLKHFPGHGDTDKDSHTELPIVTHDRARLDAVEIAAFRIAIEGGAEAVMLAHIWFPALEPEPELPASLSPRVVTGLLREELGFEGIIMTDALDMDSIDTRYSYEEAAVRAVNAGVDLLAPGPGISLTVQERMFNAVLEGVRDGTIDPALIDTAAARILAMKERYGLFDWEPLDPAGAEARVNAARGTEVVDALFRAGVTIALDRNDLLPLNPLARNTIIFLGTRYQIQAECSTYSPNIRWVGVSDSPSSDEIGWAVEAARDAEAVVVFTQNADEFPRQADLVNALPQEKTIGVALFSPYDWQLYPSVAGYVATYSPMRPAVPAACAALFGAIPNVGRLPVTLGDLLPAGSRAD